ncbi:hypothetical protein C4573_07185 [Candidatus Woesearchaeota archaeon]|nr:MAG: hypothetical protein C4573_07185 [Candidatus Woesearchaeota archaeon]
MLTDKELKEIKHYLDESKNPLFFFDDDGDGTCSFLLCYYYKKEGYGVLVNSTPRLTKQHLKKVAEYQPDAVFILDLAEVDQEFIDGCNCTIVWIDHHQLLEREKVNYYNPRKHDAEDNSPVTYWCYRALGGPIWIAAVGTIADWYISPVLEEFKKQYPDMIEAITTPEDLLYHSNLGTLFRIINFNLKGTAKQAMQSVKVMTRIKEPYEITQQKTSQGKYILKKYEKVNKEYEEQIQNIKIADETFIVFYYQEKQYSFTADISNYLVAHYPKSFIIVVRQKDDEYRCSLRGSTYNVLDILKKSLVGIEGYGGGHEHASGCCIKTHDFPKFLDNIRKEL